MSTPEADATPVEEEERFMGDILNEAAMSKDETKEFDAKTEAAALHTIFSDDGICATCASKLSEDNWGAATDKFNSWKDSDPEELGAAIKAVMDHLDADHLQPSSMVERLNEGIDACAFGVQTLMQNLADPPETSSS
eukprot:gnl/MRDRNA2_/MRDRNA2_26155_c0_seq1.p1 gnl/MRDRNA2_/MRDRNA2_26155_c0~~gnl/MRDRNA2_/MRDRNA2_26155_c0_seq1.p1  ORF type:complete len:137 (-),score=45.36 gnl/MRDRNA2_/MRDRNA2_26155_c0_seq1:232-642(-)